MEQKREKTTVNITNNFNAPIGQHIDHVDTINFRMDGDGQFHFGMVEKVKMEKKEISDEQLARAIENCQALFWGNSAYAVVFCICRDEYMMGSNKSSFEKMVEQLPYKKERDHKCPTGTIANAFNNNPIFGEDIMDWESFNPLPRIIKLRDELLKELML